jgi:hypothetical protein
MGIWKLESKQKRKENMKNKRKGQKLLLGGLTLTVAHLFPSPLSHDPSATRACRRAGPGWRSPLRFVPLRVGHGSISPSCGTHWSASSPPPCLLSALCAGSWRTDSADLGHNNQPILACVDVAWLRICQSICVAGVPIHMHDRRVGPWARSLAAPRAWSRSPPSITDELITN